jgi:four helix bundle protein
MICKVTGGLHRQETYGLATQLRRCSASIPANIAEGCGRSGDAELGRFMPISMSSACELEYLLPLSRDPGYLDSQRYRDLFQRTQEIKRMLSTFITKLRHTKS